MSGNFIDEGRMLVVKKGVVDAKASGIFKVNNKAYVVKNGVIDGAQG